MADRLLEYTRTIRPESMENQLLDTMDLERERGITIKSHAIQMIHAQGENRHIMNLIDTPGHVDFSYEVSRSMAACEGALLLVDASQGMEAQTLSNLYMATDNDLTIIPVVNKIDMEAAMVEEVCQQIVEFMGCDPGEIIRASAKNGTGVKEIIEAVIGRIPPPKGSADKPLKAMIFDSLYNSYRGIVVYLRIYDGSIRAGDLVQCVNTGVTFDVEEVGILKLGLCPRSSLGAGEVGYLVTGVKSVEAIKVGDTITHKKNLDVEAIQGFKEVKPMVFAGIFPVDTSEVEELKKCIEKLHLNDSSFTWSPESSVALGNGFRCGFLGLLHMEIVQQRLEREYGIHVITTIPSVVFRVVEKSGKDRYISSPSQLPHPQYIDFLEEPYVSGYIITRVDFIGPVIDLCLDKRGTLVSQKYLGDKVEIIIEIPMVEIVYDFFVRLKSVSRGYASFDYELIGYRKSKLVKLEIQINGEKVDPFSCIIHKDKSHRWGKQICEKLASILPRQLFEIAIQACVGSKIIARETIRAMRKNVIAKCYGGDVSRKRKLLEKQKKGKKKMKQIGNVDVPQEAFLAILKMEN